MASVSVELNDFDEDDIIEYVIDDIIPYTNQTNKDKISKALKESYTCVGIEAKTIEEKDKLYLLNKVFNKFNLIELETMFPNI